MLAKVFSIAYQKSPFTFYKSFWQAFCENELLSLQIEFGTFAAHKTAKITCYGLIDDLVRVVVTPKKTAATIEGFTFGKAPQQPNLQRRNSN